MINTFYLDAESAEAYGLIMLAPPDHVVAERDIERKEVPGRSGDVIIDNGRYKNVTVKYSCAILPEDGVPYRTTVARAVQFLKSGPAYKQLRNTYDPDRFREARVQGSYNGTYGLAMTQDGQIVADYITTGTLSANLLRAGVLQDKTGKVFKLDLDAGTLNANFTSLQVSGKTPEQIAAEKAKEAADAHKDVFSFVKPQRRQRRPPRKPQQQT